MKRYAIALAALLLSASAVMADPVFTTGHLFGAYVINTAGTGPNGAFNYTGILRFDGVGHLVDTSSEPSVLINYSVATVQCRFNLMTPTLAEMKGIGPGTNLYTVSPVDSSVRIPVKYEAFASQAPICQSTNGAISTLSGFMVSPGLVDLNQGGGGAGAGTLVKQSQN